MSQQINLFNPVFRPRGFSFTSAQSMLYAVGIAAAMVALSAAYGEYELKQVVARAQASGQAHKQATERLAQLSTEVAQQKPNAQIEADVAALEVQLKGRQEVVETLRSGVVGNTSGFSEYMRAFSRQTVNGLWLTGFEFDGNDLVLHGRTLNAELVANFLKQLNREQALQGREFSAMRIRQPPPDVDTPAAEADKGAKDAKAAPGRYLEFSISTAPLPDEPQRAAMKTVSAPAPQSRNPAPGTPPVDLGKVIDAAKAAAKQELAK
jgi:hypothetical protein